MDDPLRSALLCSARRGVAGADGRILLPPDTSSRPKHASAQEVHRAPIRHSVTAGGGRTSFSAQLATARGHSPSSSYAQPPPPHRAAGRRSESHTANLFVPGGASFMPATTIYPPLPAIVPHADNWTLLLACDALAAAKVHESTTSSGRREWSVQLPGNSEIVGLTAVERLQVQMIALGAQSRDRRPHWG